MKAALVSATDPKSEGCYEYAWLNIEGTKPVKLCGGQGLEEVGGVYFIRKAGGNAAGWGLYRYNPATKTLDFYDFNAREIKIGEVDDLGVWLDVTYAVHAPEGGYEPDRRERWYWAYQKKKPRRQKSR
ncbi:MAG: hypothetical protein GC129_00450 [Proteobacteria bacterium]|nr:hypothetical protein [Pseudomonadota bacterium]